MEIKFITKTNFLIEVIISLIEGEPRIEERWR